MSGTPQLSYETQRGEGSQFFCLMNDIELYCCALQLGAFSCYCLPFAAFSMPHLLSLVRCGTDFVTLRRARPIS